MTENGAPIPSIPYKEFNKRVASATGIVILLVTMLYFLFNITHILLLIFAAIMLAILFDTLALGITNITKLPRVWALTAAIVFFFAAVAAIGWFIGPSFTEQFDKLGSLLPKALEMIQHSSEDYPWLKEVLPDDFSFSSLLPPASGLVEQITGIFSSAVGLLINVVIIVFVGIYFAATPELYTKNTINLFSFSKRPRIEKVFTAIGFALRWWLLGRFVAMILVGILVTVGFTIIGMPSALALGIIAAVLSFIPFIGPTLSFIPALLVAILDGPTMVLSAAITYLTIQMIEGYLITPNIEHQAVSIPPAFVLIIQILMGAFAGIFGILLATPFAVVIIISVQILYVQDVLGDQSIEILGDKHKHNNEPPPPSEAPAE